MALLPVITRKSKACVKESIKPEVRWLRVVPMFDLTLLTRFEGVVVQGVDVDMASGVEDGMTPTAEDG